MKIFYAVCFNQYIMFKIEAQTYTEAQKMPKKVYPLPCGTYGIKVVTEDYVKSHNIGWESDDRPCYGLRENGTLSLFVSYTTKKAYFEAFENVKTKYTPVQVANLTASDYDNMIQHEFEDWQGIYFFRVYPQNKKYQNSVFEMWQELRFADGEIDC